MKNMCRADERSLDLTDPPYITGWWRGPWAMGGHFAPFSGVRRRHAFYKVLWSAMSSVLWVMINIAKRFILSSDSLPVRIKAACRESHQLRRLTTNAGTIWALTLGQIMYHTQLTLESRQDETQSLAHWWWVPRSLEENPEWLNTVLPCKSL